MQNLISYASQDKDKIIGFSNHCLSNVVTQNINAESSCAHIQLNYFQVNSIEQFHERLLGPSLSKTMLSWRFLFSTTAKYLLTSSLQQELELFCKHVEDKIYTDYDLNFTPEEQLLLEILRIIIS